MATKYIRFLSASDAAALPAGQAVMLAVAVDGDGEPVDLGGDPYTLPAATTTAMGGVKKASATVAVSASDAAAAAADTVTKAEFDAVVALANANKAAINDIISKAKTAGQMA